MRKKSYPADAHGLGVEGRAPLNEIFTPMEKSRLCGREFRCVELNRVDFSRADLRHSEFLDVSLRAADFSGADLRGACFIRCDLRDACFDSAVLDGARFDGSWVVGAIGLSAAERDRIRSSGGFIWYS